MADETTQPSTTPASTSAGEGPEENLALVVRRITAPTPRIRLLELATADGAALPGFTAGSHIDVDMPIGEGRSYSLLNDPAETNRYVIAVLREELGRGGSAWMHDTVCEGDVLTVAPPTNHFALNEAAEAHLLIAGGIGITPIMAMVARLLRLGASFSLHYCARSPEETAFGDDLAARLGDRLHLYHDGGDPARGLDVAALLGRRAPGSHVYVCGPRGLIQAVRGATTAWPTGTVHWEAFSGSDEDTAPRTNDQPFEVELAKSGKVLMVGAGEKILDVLRANDVRVKSLCKDGVCGTCRVKYLAGAVDHRDDVLTNKQRTQFLQVCVSRALPGERLVLDL
jgi:ferredoxin-NADP reductase